ncbi:MAG: hypothetical protein [Arizlama microvirus]|nr:MAG: hypothetical protein [Arizlama microvirus]
MKRHKMSRRSSRKSFRKGAMRVHHKNVATPMRGGWRL